MKTDAQLQTDVLDELRMDARIDASDIGVAVHDGVVTLAGVVTSVVARTAIVQAAQRVVGVRVVADELHVHLPIDDTRSDADIAHAAVSALMWDTEVPDGSIKARVQDGWIWLVGEADWNYQRVAAERAVESIIGVKGVTNIVRIRKRGTPPALKSDIERALARHALLAERRIHVDVDEHAVILAGEVRSWNERMAAEHAVWSAAGVVHVDNRLQIAA